MRRVVAARYVAASNAGSGVCLRRHVRRAPRRAMFRSHIARVCSQTSLRFEVNDWGEWLKTAFYMEGSLFGWAFLFFFPFFFSAHGSIMSDSSDKKKKKKKIKCCGVNSNKIGNVSRGTLCMFVYVKLWINVWRAAAVRSSGFYRVIILNNKARLHLLYMPYVLSIRLAVS